MAEASVLIASEDGQERASLASCVAAAGYTTAVSGIGDAARLAGRVHPAALLLDVTGMRPDEAAALTGALRPAMPGPLLAIVAARDTMAGAAALDAGADDFMPRPSAVPELRARLRALLRPRHHR